MISMPGIVAYVLASRLDEVQYTEDRFLSLEPLPQLLDVVLYPEERLEAFHEVLCRFYAGLLLFTSLHPLSVIA